MEIYKRYIVSGRVQGVFYRASTQEKAKALNLCGWVRNLSSGEVEVYVLGEESLVKELANWLWQGPSSAKVTDVKEIVTDFESLTEFEIR